MPDQPMGENAAFFVLQGLLCYMQIQLQRASGFGKTWGTGVGGVIVGWLWTMFFMAATGPLFVGPYARSGLFFDTFVLPVPRVLVDFFKSIL
ncbi:hypothetical protein HK100_007131, partial [Physocladia obscura]